MMWVVYRDVPGIGRMFYTGCGADFSSTGDRAACWQDRRDADMVRHELEFLPRPVNADSWKFGTACIAMREADPTQYVAG